MLQRTSVVDHIEAKIVSYSSVLQIGDSAYINGLNRALAIQRETELFFGNEGNYAAYRIFSEPIPIEPVYELVSFIRHNPNPIIKVNNIDITGISSSSFLHVGNSGHISLEARVKHIRQINPRS